MSTSTILTITCHQFGISSLLFPPSFKGLQNFKDYETVSKTCSYFKRNSRFTPHFMTKSVTFFKNPLNPPKELQATFHLPSCHHRWAHAVSPTSSDVSAS